MVEDGIHFINGDLSTVLLPFAESLDAGVCCALYIRCEKTEAIMIVQIKWPSQELDEA